MNREGSSPSPPIGALQVLLSRGSGSVVEHLLAKEKVAGSIPVSRFNLSSWRIALYGYPLWGSASLVQPARHRSLRI